MNWQLFVSIFSLMLLAELPDKTIFATIMMATRGHPVAIFIGVALAFLVQTTVAIVFGRLFSLFPEHWVHLVTGILFLGFAVYSWKESSSAKEPDDGEAEQILPSSNLFSHFWKAFVVIFIAEWGDLTQITTASLMARYPGELATVFTASVLALWTATGLAIIVGVKMKTFINPRIFLRIGAALFAIIGVSFIAAWFR